MKRLIAACAIAAAVATATIFACGGKIASGPAGTLDDAGIFHQPDGHVVFAPGSACIGYDAAHYIQVSSEAPPCDEVTGTESPSCEAWVADAGLSFGYLPYAQCRFGRCSMAESSLAINAHDPAVACVWGPEGNAYCQAFYQQFVVDGTASGGCTLINGVNDRGQNGVCNPNGCGMADHIASLNADGSITVDPDGGGELAGVPVVGSGGYNPCEWICQP